MSHPMETTLQSLQRIHFQRESLQGILYHHLHPSAEKRHVPRLLGGHAHLQRCRQLLVAYGCEESRLRQRLRHKPSPDLPSRTPHHWWVLQAMDAQDDKASFPLAGPTLVGRGSECELMVPLPEISRKHVSLVPNQVYVALEDLHSANGTAVNGLRVERTILQDGDLVTLAGVTFVLLRHRTKGLDTSGRGCLLA